MQRSADPAAAAAAALPAPSRPAAAPGAVAGSARDLAPATLAVLAGSAGALLGSFAVRWLLARTLAPASLGTLSLALALAGAAGGIAGLGLPALAAQRIAAALAAGRGAAAGATARATLLLATLAGGGLALALAVAAPALGGAFGDPGLGAALRAVAPVVLGLAVGLAALGIARGHSDVAGRALWRDALGGVTRLAGVGSAAVLAPGLLGAAAGFAAGALAADAAFVARVVRRGWVPRGRELDPGLAGRVPPYLGGEVLSQAAQWLDVLLLGWLATPAAVGVYAAARSLGRLLDLVAEAAGHRFLPVAAGAWATGGAAALLGVFGRTRAFVVALCWPAVAVLLLAPGPLVTALFGTSYAAAAAPLRWLAAGTLVAVAAGYAEKAMVAAGRPGEVVAARLGGLAVMVAVSLAAIPRLGAAGAAIGWAVGVSVQRAVLAHRLRRVLGGLPAAAEVRVTLLRCGLATAPAALALPWLRPPALAAALVLACAAGGAAWALRPAGGFRAGNDR